MKHGILLRTDCFPHAVIFSKEENKMVEKLNLGSEYGDGLYGVLATLCEQDLWGAVPLSCFHSSESLQWQWDLGSPSVFWGRRRRSRLRGVPGKPPSSRWPAAVLPPPPWGPSRGGWLVRHTPLMCRPLSPCTGTAWGRGRAARARCWPRRKPGWWMLCWSARRCHGAPSHWRRWRWNFPPPRWLLQTFWGRTGADGPSHRRTSRSPPKGPTWLQECRCGKRSNGHLGRRLSNWSQSWGWPKTQPHWCWPKKSTRGTPLSANGRAPPCKSALPGSYQVALPGYNLSVPNRLRMSNHLWSPLGGDTVSTSSTPARQAKHIRMSEGFPVSKFQFSE